MKHLESKYHVLDKPEEGSWSKYFRIPSLLLNWTFSFFLRRIIINIALGPNEIVLQPPFHVMFTTDDRREKGSVIINILPPKSIKPAKNFYHYLPSLSSKVQKALLSFKNQADKAYIDSVIDEIGHFLAGNSTQPKCKNKKFAIEDLHLKGIERLDAELLEYFKKQLCQKYGEDFFEQPRTTPFNFYTLETSDNATLESVEIAGPDEKMKPISERKFIISCMARNQNYMFWLKDLYTSATRIGCTVISFNYRGIDYSEGNIWTHHDMVNDTFAQAQRLLELGAKPENITFEGMSMGGAVATIAAAKMHEQDLKVILYNERSYRSFTRLMVGYTIPEANSNPWNPLNWFRYVVAGLSYCLLTPVIWIAGWSLNAASAWDKIPQAYKTYSVARNHENPEQYDDDEYVCDSFASIASLIDEHQKAIQEKQNKGEALTAEQKQLLADKAESHQFTLDRNNTLNNNLSPHAAPRRFLVDTKTRNTDLHTYMIEQLRLKMDIKPSEADDSDEAVSPGYTACRAA